MLLDSNSPRAENDYPAVYVAESYRTIEKTENWNNQLPLFLSGFNYQENSRYYFSTKQLNAFSAYAMAALNVSHTVLLKYEP